MGAEQEQPDYRLFELNHNLKRKIWLTQLTAARLQCSMMNKKLFFGKPCPLLAIERLAANLELEQLRHMLHESLNEYKERAEERRWYPATAPIDVHNRLKEVASDLFREELYGDQMDY